MIPADELAEMQDTATDAMTDAVKFVRPSTSVTLDARTNRNVSAAPTVIYAGCASIAPVMFRSRVVETGEEQVTVKRYTVRIPTSAIPPNVGDAGVITRCAADESVVNRTLRVIDVPRMSLLIERAVIVEFVE